MTTSPTFTVSYTIAGSICTLVATTAGTGASNSTSFTFTGLPGACQPATTTSYLPCTQLENNTTTGLMGVAQVAATSGTVTLALASVSGSSVSGAGAWTASGTKAVLVDWTITYSLL
jgi:hypothetical protein